MNLSLCLIVGNEEPIIARCLESFKPIADEIIVVRAVGALKPDRTLEIAQSYGAKTFEYFNTLEHADWEHVDDFGAARQMSFDHASGEYRFWVDADDILDPTYPEDAVKKIRAMAEEAKFDVIYFPYKLAGDGTHILRDRMSRRGKAHWVYPIHEVLKHDDDALKAKSDIPVLHLPPCKKRNSNIRNLRILESIAEPSPRNLFYLNRECLSLGLIEKASRYAVRAIESGKLEAYENYDLLLSMGPAAPNLEMSEKIFLEALRVSPHRREALGMLVDVELKHGNAAHALAYAQMMASLPEPKQKDVLHRQEFYQFKGIDLYAQALRVNGRAAEAQKLMEKVFNAGGAWISVIHPTRGRPSEAETNRARYYALAEKPEGIEYIFGFSEDDEPSRAALSRYIHACSPAGVMNQVGGTCVANARAALALAQGKILLIVADDMHPCQSWDRLIIEKFKNKFYAPYALHLSDGFREDNWMTIPCVNRKFVEKFGGILDPAFRGIFADLDFSYRAYQSKIVLEGREIQFLHHHPYFIEGKPWDAIYEAQNSQAAYDFGKEVFDHRNPEFKASDQFPLTRQRSRDWELSNAGQSCELSIKSNAIPEKILISLVHATRKRAAQARQTRAHWLSTARSPVAIEHLFVIDSDDEASRRELAEFSPLIVEPTGGCVAAYNAGAKRTGGAIILPISDDFVPCKHWDALIIERIGDASLPRLLSMNDGFRKDALIGICAFTRARFNQLGYLFHPRFINMYSDNWLTYESYRDGVIIHARDVVIEHRHPAFGKAAWDDTYRRANANENYESGKRIFEELMAEEQKRLTPPASHAA